MNQNRMHTRPMSTHLYSNNEHVQFYHKCAHIDANVCITKSIG